MAKSFFERLTGSARVSDETAKEPVLSPEAAAPQPLKVKKKNSSATEERKAVLHPVAAEGERVPEETESAEEEEGQLTVDIYDDGANIVIQSTVAGVKPEDIDISLQEDTLIIRGSRKRQKEIEEDNFYYKELYWGSFSRSIILPEEVEFQKADAVIKHGLLTIKLPKKDKGLKQIRVKVGD